MKSQTIIFCDGASKGNPGPGGWGAIVASVDRVVELGDREAHTTNNRMELVAAIRALEKALGDTPTVVHTDSSYVINGVTKWLNNWKKRGWKTLQKKGVMNEDLWRELDEILEWRTAPVTWHYVGGHVGVAGNERVDEIASGFAEGDKPELFSGKREQYKIDISNITHDSTTQKKRSAAKARSRAVAYSYVSMIDGKIEVCKTWAECERRVKGVGGAKYKKSLNAEDEAAIIAEWEK